MRKILIFTAVAAMAIMASSCGAQKKTASVQTDERVKVWKSEAQIYAEDPNRTNLRAWAQYNGFPQERLESIAANRARTELTKEISVLVIEAYNEIAEGITENLLTEGADTALSSKKGMIDKYKSEIESSANQLLKGCRIVMSDRYKEKNGTETAYVCVEMPLEAIVESVAESKTFKTIFTPEETEKVGDKKERVRKSLKAGLEEIKRKGI